MSDLFVYAILLIGGLLAHFLMKFRELRKSEQTLTLKQYVKANPYQIAYSTVSAFTVAVALWHYGELTAITAAGVGYMADSVMDKFTNRTTAALR